MKPLRVILSLVLLATLTAAVSAAASVAPRVVTASGPGVSAKVTIGAGSSAELAYVMTTKCGRSSGTVKLTKTAAGSYKGTSRKSAQLVKAQVTSASDRLSGLIRYSSATGKGKPCRAKRSFKTDSQSSSGHGLAGSTGHYAGTGNSGGHPISFDVSLNKGTLEISNLSVQTEAECWQDFDNDGNDDVIVAQVDGLSGKVEDNGSFYIDVTPDEDNWYTVSGTLRDGKAKMDVLVGGFWGLDGRPMSNGPYECESWGEGYSASR